MSGKIKSGLLLVLLAAISGYQIAAQKKPKILKIAIVDTGFCAAQIQTGANVRIYESFDATGDSNEDACLLPENHPRRHGQKVLEVFLKNLDSKINLEIYPMTVFDRFGGQKISYWQKAYEKASALKIKMILTASGVPHSRREIKYPEWNILTLAPAGKIGGAIKPDTLLFPQLLAPRKNLFIIGSLDFDEEQKKYIPDERTLYKNFVDFYQPASGTDSTLRGGSYSVALFAARAVSQCAADLTRKCFVKNLPNPLK